MKRILSLVLLLLAATARGDLYTLFDDDAGTLPADQGWLFYGGVNDIQQNLTSEGVRLTSDNGAQGGYSSHLPLFNIPTNPAWPVLDSNEGFTLFFELQLFDESHLYDARSGFSVLLFDANAFGVELSFWLDEIWVKDDDGAFSHAEGVFYDTTAALTSYALHLENGQYSLSADGSPLLNGSLRDYSAFGTPYDLSSYLFLGDDTTSAGADVLLGNISLLTGPMADPVPEAPAWLLLLAALPLISRLLKNAVFRQLVRGTGKCRHFQWL